MRFLLAIMAMTLFAVSVGCDKPAESITPDPAATGDVEPAEGSDSSEEAGSDATSDVGATGETQTVSLKLPGMTWGGCERSVKNALKGIDGVADIELKNRAGTFTAPAGLDVEATLNKIVEGGNEEVKGWSMAE